MQNGTVFQLPTLAPRITGTAFGWLPTPQAGDSLTLQIACNSSRRSLWRKVTRGGQGGMIELLSMQTDLSATEMVEFVGEMMGFPPAWTECTNSGTLSSPPSSKSSAAHS